MSSYNMDPYGSAILLLLLVWTCTGVYTSQDHHSLDHLHPNHDLGRMLKDCSKLNSPLSMKDKNPVLGKFHFLAGFTDNSLYKTLLHLTSSFWFNVTNTQTGLGLVQMNKMKGTCVESRANITISGDKATFIMENITSVFQFVNFSSSLMILNVKASASNISSFAEKLHLDPSKFSPDLSAQSFYLMGRDAEVNETDLQLFKEHASCAGFTGEPDYIHQPDQEYCSKDESVLTIF